MVQGFSALPNKAVLVTAVAVAALVVVIGCGGGGASTTGTGTATATATATSTATATATSTATSTSTSTSTSTGTSTGILSGNLPSNEVIYTDDSDLGGGNFDVNIFTVNPDGTNPQTYSTFLGNTYPVAAPNPNSSSAGTGAVVFAYLDPTSQTYDLYTNATVTVTGAKRLTTGSYQAIGTLQFSPDGTKVLFVGTNSLGNFLFEVNADGSNQIRNIDSADDFYLGGDNKTICYTKDDASSNGQIWIIDLDGTNIRQLTNDAYDHFGPQLSKDVSHIAYAANELGMNGGYDTFTSAIDGTQLVRATNTGQDEAITPAFNTDGTQVAYVFLSSSNTAASGVYYVGINGLGTTQIVQDSAVALGLYWTSSQGILGVGGSHGATPSFGHSLHIAYLKKHGKWHH